MGKWQFGATHSYTPQMRKVHGQQHASHDLSLGNRLSIGRSVGSRLAGYFGEEKNVLPQLGIEPRLLGCALLHHVTTTKALTARCNAVRCQRTEHVMLYVATQLSM